jgi:iron complex transport system substrate-binding protein
VAAVQTRVRLAAALGVMALLGAAEASPSVWRGVAPGLSRPEKAIPRRIVSLVPATTEMLFAIGAGDRVAGVSSYDRHPPEVDRLPRLGGLLDPSVERLLALKPDLVVVYGTQSELRRQLEGAGIPTFPYVHRGLADITETIRALGARIGSEREARALADRMETQLTAIRSRVAGRPRPKALLVFGREPGSLRRVEASGGYGFLHDMLATAGGDDVLADIARESVQMSAEMVLARAPDVIIELRYGEADTGPTQDSVRRAWSALPAVPAVKTGRIYLLVGDEFVVPGPRVVDAVQRLAAVLHPDGFK